MNPQEPKDQNVLSFMEELESSRMILNIENMTISRKVGQDLEDSEEEQTV